MKSKAQLFEAGLVLIALLVSGTALYGFIVLKQKVDVEIMAPTKLLELYEEQAKFSFYAQQAAQLAGQQAFYGVREKIGREGCTFYERHIIWSEACKPDKELIEKAFFEDFNKSFNGFIEAYPVAAMQGAFAIKPDDVFGSLALKSQAITLNSSEKGKKFKLELNHTFNLSFTFNLSEIDFSSAELVQLHYQLWPRFKECKEEFKEGTELRSKIKGCVAETRLDGWNIAASEAAAYLLLNISSKRSYFFIDEEGKMRFEQIVLKAAFEF